MFERITAMLSDYLKVDKSKITRDTDIKKDLKADSLLVVEMLFALEDETGITIPDEMVEELTNVGKLTDYIEANMPKGK
ncbi:MAG: acyl carrier protein [Clostridia bacterium]|jgi:acyl carrier protein|nr:acyl carrier protein [Clostridia bacterium]